VRCSTPREATNLGIFFSELMALVQGWRDPATFARECASSEAFRSYQGGVLAAVSHHQFVKLSANWHRKMTTDVFGSCLASADYMQMKNALLVLNRCVRIYPATREDAAELLRGARPVADADAREDLKTLARMYCTALGAATAGRDKSRVIVDTRQEYAGLKPPRKKKAAAAAAAAVERKEKDGRESGRRSGAGKEAVAAAAGGPPPGFGAFGKQAAAAGAAAGGGGGREGLAEVRERPGSDRERARGREERLGPARQLRVDAAPFQPSGGKESGRAREAEAPAVGEADRDAKRARTERDAARGPERAERDAPASLSRGGQAGRRSTKSEGAEAAAPTSKRDHDDTPHGRERERTGGPAPEVAPAPERSSRRPNVAERELDEARTAARASLPEQSRRPGLEPSPQAVRRDRDGGRLPERLAGYSAERERELPRGEAVRQPVASAKERERQRERQQGHRREQEREQQPREQPPEIDLRQHLNARQQERQRPLQEERVPRSAAPLYASQVAALEVPSARPTEVALESAPDHGNDSASPDRDGHRKRRGKKEKKEKRKGSRRDRERGRGGGGDYDGDGRQDVPEPEEREGKRRRVEEAPAAAAAPRVEGADALPPRLRDRLGAAPQDPGSSGGRRREHEVRHRDRGSRRQR
jgi:THO complex subunit 2